MPKHFIYHRIAILSFCGVFLVILAMIITCIEPKRDIDFDESLQDQFVQIASDGVLNLDIDFESLEQRNKDIIGWIYIPGTNINYPVVQCDNNQLYLNQRFDGSSTPYGTIFLDHRNDIKKSNNVVLYGHNQGPLNPVKFTQLSNFVTDPSFIREHEYFEFYSKDGTAKAFKVFSALRADITTQENINSYYLERKDKESYTEYLKWLQGQSLVISEADVNPSKQAMILSTCTDDADWQRVLVCGIEVASTENK